jgi:hypothetical protein
MARNAHLDGELMELVHIPAARVDMAWRDGAHHLSQACRWADREVTPDQLKMMLARNERQLLGLRVDGEYVAWAAVQVQQLPNIRVLYVYSIYAPGSTGPDAFRLLGDIGRAEGCTSIRGACVEQVARLWEKKFQAKRLYNMMEIDL